MFDPETINKRVQKIQAEKGHGCVVWIYCDDKVDKFDLLDLNNYV